MRVKNGVLRMLFTARDPQKSFPDFPFSRNGTFRGHAEHKHSKRHYSFRAPFMVQTWTDFPDFPDFKVLGLFWFS